MGEIYCDRNDRRQLIGDVECGGFWVRLPSHPVSPTTRKITPRPNQPHTGHTTNCYNVPLLVGSCVQIKPSHDSPDHLCPHPKQKHCKPLLLPSSSFFSPAFIQVVKDLVRRLIMI